MNELIVDQFVNASKKSLVVVPKPVGLGRVDIGGNSSTFGTLLSSQGSDAHLIQISRPNLGQLSNVTFSEPDSQAQDILGRSDPPHLCGRKFRLSV